MPLTASEDSQPDRGAALIILVSVLTSLSVISTAVRLGVRGLKHQLGWDDLTISLAVALALTQWTFNILEVGEGFGRHIKALSEAQTQNSIKYTWIAEIVLFFVLPLTKISICFFIFRIKHTGWLKRFLYGLMAGLVLTNGACIIILLTQCQPMRAYWDRSAGTCWSANIYDDTIWIQVGYGILSDLTYSLLPIVILWNVKIALRFKVGISGLMSLGLIATACAAVRAYLSAQANGSSDLTWDLALVTDWAILEEHFAILGANLALSRYVFLFFRYGKRGSKQAPSTQSYAIPESQGRRTGAATTALKQQTSFDSQVPLTESTIVKTTDLFIINEPHICSADKRAGSSNAEGLHSPDVVTGDLAV